MLVSLLLILNTIDTSACFGVFIVNFEHNKHISMLVLMSSLDIFLSFWSSHSVELFRSQSFPPLNLSFIINVSHVSFFIFDKSGNVQFGLSFQDRFTLSSGILLDGQKGESNQFNKVCKKQNNY